jgi:3-deoxy-D-manno-octulosonic-acid transferase
VLDGFCRYISAHQNPITFRLQVFYNIGIALYALAVRLVYPFKKKARLWVKGRKNWASQYSKIMAGNETKKVVWFHCASLGEFEMARPIIEKVRSNYNDQIFILISFFSPSGYEVQKKYPISDAVVYLPLDTRSNARKFIQIFNPSIGIFVKYEVWVHYFNELKNKNAQLILMNAAFRRDQRFFKWYGGIFREALKKTDKIFVQNQTSIELLKKYHLDAEITGDTRYDRVLQIKEQPKNIEEIEKWVNKQYCIVLGSSWPAEESVVQKIIYKLPENIKWIIAAHDVSKNHIEKIVDQFAGKQVLLSKLTPADYGKNVLIVDSIGKLSQIYSLANLAIVGGGFSGKLHNILEPAVYGIPILFGPYHSRFTEAIEMTEKRSAISFYDETDIVLYIEWFYYDHVMVDNVKQAQSALFDKNKGAVEKVFGYIDSAIKKII